jgi:hypothetical protein
MWCMRGNPGMLQLHLIVDRPLTVHGSGKISCIPRGTPPFDFEWAGPKALQTNTDGDQVFGVVPGRYRVTVIDRNDLRGEAVVDVEPVVSAEVFIQEYRVTQASTTTSRDGSVEAVGVGLEHYSLLWSNGVCTEGALLSDVSCGTYCAVPLPKDGKIPTLVHNCAPAVVEPMSN